LVAARACSQERRNGKAAGREAGRSALGKALAGVRIAEGNPIRVTLGTLQNVPFFMGKTRARRDFRTIFILSQFIALQRIQGPFQRLIFVGPRKKTAFAVFKEPFLTLKTYMSCT
jgi:hypothetical protein